GSGFLFSVGGREKTSQEELCFSILRFLRYRFLTMLQGFGQFAFADVQGSQTQLQKRTVRVVCDGLFKFRERGVLIPLVGCHFGFEKMSQGFFRRGQYHRFPRDAKKRWRRRRWGSSRWGRSRTDCSASREQSCKKNEKNTMGHSRGRSVKHGEKVARRKSAGQCGKPVCKLLGTSTVVGQGVWLLFSR